MKHSVLMNKVRDAGVKKTKPRRPGNKLKTDMESLASALPELEDMLGEGEGEDDEWEGVESGDEEMNVDGSAAPKQRRRRAKKNAGEGKMEMKSLKHKPGAMKRKRVLEGREMERFGKNLAQLVGSVQRGGSVAKTGEGEAGAAGAVGTAAPVVAAQADRWAALRGFIGGSMEQNPAFVKG